MIGNVGVYADQPHRSSGIIPFDLGLGQDPPELSIRGTDNAILNRITLAVTLDSFNEPVLRPVAILLVDTPHPVFVRLVSLRRRQAMDRQIFGGAFVAKARRQIDLQASKAADVLDSRQFRLSGFER